MNTINIHNYEAFLLDYLENNLSDNQQTELMEFLAEHPELNIDLNDLKNDILICDESIVFEDKNKLKQMAIESLMIAEVEGINDENDNKELMGLLEIQPTLQKEFELYKRSILIPPQIVFLGKENLRQDKPPTQLIYWWLSSAAAIILALFILKISINTEINNTKQIGLEVKQSLNQSKEMLPSNRNLRDNKNQEQSEYQLVNKTITIEKKEKNEKQQFASQEIKVQKNQIPDKSTSEEIVSMNNTVAVESNDMELVVIEPYLEEDHLMNVITIEPIDEETLTEINQPVQGKNENSFIWILADKIVGEKVALAKQADPKGKLKSLRIGGFSYTRKP